MSIAAPFGPLAVFVGLKPDDRVFRIVVHHEFVGAGECGRDDQRAQQANGHQKAIGTWRDPAARTSRRLAWTARSLDRGLRPVHAQSPPLSTMEAASSDSQMNPIAARRRGWARSPGRPSPSARLRKRASPRYPAVAYRREGPRREPFHVCRSGRGLWSEGNGDADSRLRACKGLAVALAPLVRGA